MVISLVTIRAVRRIQRPHTFSHLRKRLDMTDIETLDKAAHVALDKSLALEKQGQHRESEKQYDLYSRLIDELMSLEDRKDS